MSPHIRQLSFSWNQYPVFNHWFYFWALSFHPQTIPLTWASRSLSPIYSHPACKSLSSDLRTFKEQCLSTAQKNSPSQSNHQAQRSVDASHHSSASIVLKVSWSQLYSQHFLFPAIFFCQRPQHVFLQVYWAMFRDFWPAFWEAQVRLAAARTRFFQHLSRQ